MKDSKYFKPHEFECKCGCGLNNVSDELIDLLDAAREEAGVPFIITSGCRCGEHNRKVGGSENSAHLRGLAADIRVSGSQARFKIKKALYSNGAKRIGHHKLFVHVDVDESLAQSVEFIY